MAYSSSHFILIYFSKCQYIFLNSPGHLRVHDSQQVLPVVLKVQGRVTSWGDISQQGLSIWWLMLQISPSVTNIT